MQEFIALAEQLAEVSAGIIMQYFRTPVAVDRKTDGSPVTVADRQAESAMRQLIMAAFPSHGIRGEEYGDHQPDARYQWTLDPIDGTKTFVAGSFLFGTLIGLLKDDQPILGALNHPLTGHLMIGAGGETRLNGDVVRVRPCASIEDALLLATTHTTVSRYYDANAYNALTRRAKIYRTWGDCHGYFLLSSGFADIMIDPVMHLWDVAPLVPIVEGAGGRITDWRGEPAVQYGEASPYGVVATAGPIHDEVLAALQAVD